MESVPEEIETEAPPQLRVLSRSQEQDEEPPRRLRVVSRSVARESPPVKTDIPEARIPAVHEEPSLAVLNRRKKYYVPGARAPSLPRDLSPPAVKYDPQNPAHGWRTKNPVQSPGPPEPKSTAEE